MKFLILISIFLVGHSEALSKLSALRHAIFHGYDKLVRPDDPVKVAFGISVLNLGMCPHKQILTTDSWLRMKWTDSRLQWNPAEWNDISSINIDSSEFWIPDIFPYNGEQVKPSSITFNNDVPKAILYSTGSVLFVPPVKHRSFCAVPADNHDHSGEYNCTLIFGSWTYHQGLVDIVPYNDPAFAQTPIDTKYFANPQVEVLDVGFVRKEVKYECCDDLYPNLTFNIHFKQNEKMHHGGYGHHSKQKKQSNEDD